VTVDDLHTLLAVQDLDTQADQLRHRRTHLPERTRLDEVTTELAVVEAGGAVATAERDELARRQAELEAELADLERRMTDLDRRMRSGTVTAPRDLQAMSTQIDAMKRRRSDLEDAELEVLEALDPIEARVAELQDRWATLDREATELRARVVDAERELDAELASVIEARRTTATPVPPELMAVYERLRQRLGGVGAAPLVGASCGGCHLALSAGALDRIRRAPADTVVTCEQCGRILVR
jgi:predicted  nucleic acid-binding Zn-ribbon protein